MSRSDGTCTVAIVVVIVAFTIAKPSLFASCSGCVAFAFAMPPTSAPPTQPSHISAATTISDTSVPDTSSKRKCNKWLVLDFDGTCTEHDTTPLLPRMASLHSGDDDATRKQRLEQFNALEQEYFEAYSEVKDRILKDDGSSNDGESAHTDTGPNTDSLDLHEALDSLDEVSTVVTNKVSESACLSGLPSHPSHMADLIGRHEELQRMTRLQAGCVAAVANAHLAGWCLGVLSINWCPNLIEAALMMPLRRHLGMNSEDDAAVAAHPKAEVWSNEIDNNGVVTLHVPGASAKRTRIQILKKRLLQESQRRQQEDSHTPTPIVIYIGDSSTDLSGLLEADIGIMLGDSKTIMGIAKRWNIELSKLSDRTATTTIRQKNGLNERDADTVWMADGWEQIEALLRDVGNAH